MIDVPCDKQYELYRGRAEKEEDMFFEKILSKQLNGSDNDDGNEYIGTWIGGCTSGKKTTVKDEYLGFQLNSLPSLNSIYHELFERFAGKWRDIYGMSKKKRNNVKWGKKIK